MSQTKFEELKNTIRELIEDDIELDEASVTGAIDGGAGPPKTPFAFSGKRKKDKKKRNKIASQSGYSIAEAKFHVKVRGLGSVIVDASGKGEAKMIVAKQLKKRKDIESVTRVGVSKAKQIDKKLESVNEVVPAGRVGLAGLASNKDLVIPKNQMSKAKRHYKGMMNYLKMAGKSMNQPVRSGEGGEIDMMVSHMEDAYDEMLALWKTVKEVKKESVNEGKYHDYRNDESMTPKQKIGRSMMEVRDTLKTLESIVGMNIRLKNEIGVDSTSYWKRTHVAMKKISERLVKLANKVGQLH